MHIHTRICNSILLLIAKTYHKVLNMADKVQYRSVVVYSVTIRLLWTTKILISIILKCRLFYHSTYIKNKMRSLIFKLRRHVASTE